MHLKHVKSNEKSLCFLVNSCHRKTCLNIFVTHHSCKCHGRLQWWIRAFGLLTLQTEFLFELFCVKMTE